MFLLFCTSHLTFVSTVVVSFLHLSWLGLSSVHTDGTTDTLSHLFYSHFSC
jgi:hypothetical protein